MSNDEIAELRRHVAELNEKLERLGEPRSVAAPPNDDDRQLAAAISAQPPSAFLMRNDTDSYAGEELVDDLDRQIVLVAPNNPKRQGSKSRRRFEYHKSAGQTLREYIDRYREDARRLRVNEASAAALAAADLRWDFAHGFIQVGR